MLKNRSRRAAALRTRTLIIAAMALVLPVTALASASPAMAEPKGIFKIFKECPTEIPIVTLCSVDTTKSGEVAIGKTKVPINKEIVQQGGFVPLGESEVEFFGLPAKNGESLSKVELNVPGGLLDFVNCEEVPALFQPICKAIFESGATQVTATTELAASEAHPVLFNELHLARERETAVTLPIRIHLKNTFLGNACYLGSEAHPIELHLTTGETKPPAGVTPLHGKAGESETLNEKGLLSLRITGNSLVENDFPVSTGVEGCGEAEIFFHKYTGFLDSIVNGKLKVPNKAGENAAVLNGELRAAAAPEVIESEKF
jgi:hypothetical protein